MHIDMCIDICIGMYAYRHVYRMCTHSFVVTTNSDVGPEVHRELCLNQDELSCV